MFPQKVITLPANYLRKVLSVQQPPGFRQPLCLPQVLSHAEKCSYESYFSLHSFHTPSIAIITMELYEIFENASTSNSLIVKFRNKTLLRRLPLLDKTVFNPYIDCKINNLIIFPIRDLTV